MNFKKCVWDDSDPTYAPCLKKIRNGYFWVSPEKYRKAGYSIKTIKMDGTADDGNDLDRAAHARVLTREMLEWFDGATQGREPGTWGWLIARYLADEYSDIHDVRPNTRLKYKKELARVENAVGSVLLSETDFTRLKMWQKAMADKGRSSSFIKKWFTHWGLALSHGIKIGDPDCLRIKSIRSEMRIKNPGRRSIYITRGQVDAIVKEADARGLGFVALSILIRFEFMLRGTDVYGQWEPSEGRGGGIQHHGKMWVDGITWDMITPDVTMLTKVISKTRDSMTEAYEWDLTAVPDIRRRLMAIDKTARTGPVIVAQDGLPPKSDYITKAFKQIVRDLGLPDELQVRDNRSGGITEAKAMVDPYTLQHAAQHTQQSTTDIYARGRSDSANKVVQMRAKR